MLADLGAQTLSADDVARAAIASGSPGFAQVVAKFGGAVVGDNGEIDRRLLGSMVFGDESDRARLEAIVHPAVAAAADAWLADQTGDTVAVVEIPLLTEIGPERRAAYGLDYVIVVQASPDAAAERVAAERAMTAEQYAARRDVQATDEARREIADYVIVNEGDLESLRTKTVALWLVLSTIAAGGVGGVAKAAETP
jgi:dephospho-CoA kinase